MHGLQGEVRLRVPPPLEGAFVCLTRVSLAHAGHDPRTYLIQSKRRHGDVFLVKFGGVEGRDGAEALRGGEVEASREDLESAGATGTFPEDIDGIEVVTKEGRAVGTLVEILDYPAGPLYRVRDGEKEHLIPAAPVFIVSIDVDAGRMVVAPPPGLLELNET